MKNAAKLGDPRDSLRSDPRALFGEDSFVSKLSNGSPLEAWASWSTMTSSAEVPGTNAVPSDSDDTKLAPLLGPTIKCEERRLTFFPVLVLVLNLGLIRLENARFGESDGRL